MSLPAFDEFPAPPPREYADAWLMARIQTAAGTVPDLASREWAQLPDSHPLKIAAVCRYARAWLRHTDPAQIEADLLDELEAMAANRREDLERGYNATLKLLTIGPSRAEILLRRTTPPPALPRRPWTDVQP